MIILICCVENAIVIHETDEEDCHESEDAADDQVSDIAEEERYCMNVDTVIDELMELRAKIDELIMKLR